MNSKWTQNSIWNFIILNHEGIFLTHMQCAQLDQVYDEVQLYLSIHIQILILNKKVTIIPIEFISVPKTIFKNNNGLDFFGKHHMQTNQHIGYWLFWFKCSALAHFNCVVDKTLRFNNISRIVQIKSKCTLAFAKLIS